MEIFKRLKIKWLRGAVVLRCVNENFFHCHKHGYNPFLLKYVYIIALCPPHDIQKCEIIFIKLLFANQLISKKAFCYNNHILKSDNNLDRDNSTVLFFHSQQRDRGPAEEKLRGVYRFARACNWNIVILEAPKSSTEVREQIKSWQPLGCIVDMNESSKYFTTASLGPTPTVFLDFDNRQSHGKTFRVNHNPDAIGILAAKHMTSLGLRHFAFVGYTHEWSWSDARKETFRQHLGKSLGSFSTFSFPAGTTVPADVRRNFTKWLSGLPRPCGILLADDGLASEVYPACAKLGLRIPNDMAILGIDDNERLCRNLRPSLSSILLDFSQAGWMVAELLHRIVLNPQLSPFVLTYNPLGITPRGSTSIKIKQENPIAEKAKKLIADLAVSGANVATIAKYFKCSRRLLELRFRESTGTTLLNAIHAARLELVYDLLRDKSISIGSIASKCGYASESALKSYFKKQTGMTMSTWREHECIQSQT